MWENRLFVTFFVMMMEKMVGVDALYKLDLDFMVQNICSGAQD
jgi:hypothetical protein